MTKKFSCKINEWFCEILLNKMLVFKNILAMKLNFFFEKNNQFEFFGKSDGISVQVFSCWNNEYTIFQ